MDWQAVIAGAGLVALLIGGYLTLRLDKLIVEKLDKRYVARDFCDERHKATAVRVARLEKIENGVE